jgi:type II secretory pathway pseudopilin PulG
LRADAGLTLVEALASLTVLALLGVLLVSGTQFARLRLTRMQASDQGKVVEAAQDLLRGRLQRTFPYVRPNTGFPTVDFDGLPDKILFSGTPPDSKAPDALQHYVLTLAPGGVLQLTMVSDLANDPLQQTRAIPLLRGVAGLDLAYFGPAAPDNQPRWRPRWEQQATLPSLVRVRVAFAPGDRRVWPDLVVGPAATLDSQCQIEVNTGGCRGRS